MLHATFVEGKASLRRWNFTSEGKAELTVADGEAPSAYVDFRERASWTLFHERTVRLVTGEQYTLSARVRRNLGYGTMRLVARTCVGETEETVAEAEIIDRGNSWHDVSVVFAAKVSAEVRVGLDARGYSELWIESVGLRHNVPPVPSYRTGLLLPPKSPTYQARCRTGAFFEAGDIVRPDVVTRDDKDGDGLWALCSVDPDGNPWLFSDNTVIKSDSLSAEEGGHQAELQLSVTSLLPGPYQVYLSDPQRDTSVCVEAKTWRRVQGGRGEVALGLMEVSGPFSLRIAHRYRTQGNPGPVYVDYVRFMPVYDAAAGLEQPGPLPPGARPVAVAETTLRLVNATGTARRREWVAGGMPFERGVFRPQGVLHVDGVSDLVTRPLVLWPDGSVKWLRLEFRTNATGGSEEALAARYGTGLRESTASSGNVVSGGPDGLTMHVGGTQVHVTNGIWDRILLRGRELVSAAPSVRMETGAPGGSASSLHQLLVESVTVENRGAHPAVLVCGRLGEAGRPGPASFKARLSETAPDTLGLQFSVVNESNEAYAPEKGCSPAVALRELTLVLGGVRIEPRTIHWPDASQAFDGSEQALLQHGSGSSAGTFAGEWSRTAAGRPVASGERTMGWVDVHGDGAGVAVGVREFFERCPTSITVRRGAAATAVEVGIWPRREGQVLRYAQGTQLTVEVALVLHDGDLADADRAGRLASVLDPLRVVLPAEYYCQAGVFGPVTHSRDERFAGFELSAEQAFRTLRSEHMNYGLEDWGDFFAPCGYVRTPTKLWTNMEWEFIAWLLIELARTGDPAYLRCADAAARHFADIDTVHYSSRPDWLGASYVHTGDTREGHQVDAPNFAHAGWPQGLLWAYYMTGGEPLREAAVGLADYVVRNMPPEGPYGALPPFSMRNCMREAGNPILTLASVYELTRDPLHLRALDRLVDYAVRVQDPRLGCWSTPYYESPAYHRPSPTWGSMLYRGLHGYWELTGDRRVEQAFLRLESCLLDLHRAETRHHLRTGSYDRTNFVFVAEAVALASLFSSSPRALLDKGTAMLLSEFPAGTPKPVGVRGLPGMLCGASRLVGAVARAGGDNPRLGARRRSMSQAGPRATMDYKITQVRCAPAAVAEHWSADNGPTAVQNGRLRFVPADGPASVVWRSDANGADVRRALTLCFPEGVTRRVDVHMISPATTRGDSPTAGSGYTFRFEPEAWTLRRGENVLAQGGAVGCNWQEEQVLLETITLGRHAQCRLNAALVYDGVEDGERVASRGGVLIESLCDAVEVLLMEEDVVEDATAALP